MSGERCICVHPFEAHGKYLTDVLLCWKNPEWVDRQDGYQACDCQVYTPATSASERCARCGNPEDIHPLCVEVYQTRPVKILRSVTGCPAFVPSPSKAEKGGT